MKPPRLLLAAALCAAFAAAASAQDDPVAGFKDAARRQAAGAQAAVAAEKAASGAVPADDAAGQVSLLPQFADASERNQGGIGSCHAFGSVAALEAAYFRANAKHLALAEEDVFLQRTVLSGDVYSEFCASGKCVMMEGNDPAGDIRYVLEHGALTTRSYTQFADRYVHYRSAEQKTMEGIQKTYEQMGWLEKLFYDPRKHWKELSTQPQSKRILTMYLEGRGSAESAERGEVQKKFAGFRLRTKQDFDFKSEYKSLPPADCLKRGAGQRAALKGELDAKRPVCVSMSLSGLAAWGQTDATRDAYHAFVVVGYDKTPAGLVFHTRNSWGGDNPDIPESQLCRIYGMNSVLAPGEKETF